MFQSPPFICVPVPLCLITIVNNIIFQNNAQRQQRILHINWYIIVFRYLDEFEDGVTENFSAINRLRNWEAVFLRLG